MVDASSYASTQPHTQLQDDSKKLTTLKKQPAPMELQRRAMEIAAESMAALFAPKRARGDAKHEDEVPVVQSKELEEPLVVLVQESALKRLKQSSGDETDAREEEEKKGGSVSPCPRRSSGSDPDMESDGGASSSAQEQPQKKTPVVRKVRVRKPTYAVRKEEKDVLIKEIQQLEAQAAFLRERAGIPDSSKQSKLGESLYLNDTIREALRQQQLGFANAQSAVLECLNAQQTNPMSSYIQLGKTWHDRRATLLALKDRKVRDAYEYVMARSKSLDPLKPHVTDDRFENAAGDYCCVRFEMTQFEGVQSVQQVFDALRFYVLNMEVVISEKLGHVTTREDYDLIDKSVSNHRLLSNENGIEIELNGVMFTHFFESHAPSNGNPCGVIAVDYVDEDELHPYSKSGRVRKDISATCVIAQHMRKKPDSDEEELVVVMTRGAFLRLHRPEMVVPPQAQMEIHDGIARWGHAMLKCMHDILYPESS